MKEAVTPRTGNGVLVTDVAGLELYSSFEVHIGNDAVIVFRERILAVGPSNSSFGSAAQLLTAAAGGSA
jgi:hypothetical protein